MEENEFDNIIQNDLELKEKTMRVDDGLEELKEKTMRVDEVIEELKEKTMRVDDGLEKEEHSSDDELREDLVERIDQVKNHNEELRGENFKLRVKKRNAKAYANFLAAGLAVITGKVVLEEVYKVLKY